MIDDHGRCIEMCDEDGGRLDVALLLLAGIAFLALKLTGVIGWSWWAVTAPLWGLVSLWTAVVLVALASAAIAVLVERRPRVAERIAVPAADRSSAR